MGAAGVCVDVDVEDWMGPAAALISSRGRSFNSHSGGGVPAAKVTFSLMGAKHSISTWIVQTPSGRSAKE